MTHRSLIGGSRPPRSVAIRRNSVSALLALALCFGPPIAQPSAGQELALKRELPAPVDPDPPCTRVEPANATPSASDREEAEVLAQEAAEAMILGDVDRARALLAAAVALDPTSAEIQLQRGRVLEERGEAGAAVVAFCRHLQLAPDGPGRAEARQRIGRLVTPSEDDLPDAARAAFRAGIERFDAGRYEEAVREFSRALVELPNWADAHFNRGLSYLRAGREGAGFSDLEQYLELEPGSPEGTLIRTRLADRSPRSVRRSPAVALATGLVVPGMGQFYTGRTGMGAVYLLGAGAMAAAGALYTEVEIQCLTIPGPEGCPSEFVQGQKEERPLLIPGVAGAAAITVIGAVHAFLSTRRQGAPGRLALGAEVPSLSGDSLSSTVSLNPVVRWGQPGLDATLTFRF